jgi:copper homeostasis protein (lipoprotein)
MKTALMILGVSIIQLGFFSCSRQPDNLNRNSPGKSNGLPVQDAGTPDGHNSRNSLDWSGVYQGTLPCADCEGIKTKITLMKDNTFRHSSTYLGRDEKIFTENGTFSWADNGSDIILKNDEGKIRQYKVGENVLFHLDQEGQIITSELAEMYVLNKNATDPRIEGKKWVLTELMGSRIEASKTGKQAFLQFNGETVMFSGNGSCNNIFGSYEIKEGNRISFGSAGSTMMACPDMETEKNFLDVLEKVDNYSVSDSILSLNRARMAPLARFVWEKEE